ncbi:MAG: cysteine desulfurase family protein [Lachnospiraceae bacterium]|nr:cysteine desulfurase family protein [Lachnospiraceae bacterium]
MRVYFDNAATTAASEGVARIVEKTMREDYGNPSSKHIMGVEAERYLREASEIIASTLKCKEKEILFTSGGTESNNTALIGCALANQRAGKHIITTGIEHASVYEPLLFLESLGFEITALPVDETGHVKLDELKKSLRPDTILVSTMMVNNEIGAIEPVEEMSKIIKGYNSGILYHVDAIQAYGKLRIYPKRLGIDMLSVSGHKIHGPKGIGFLYIDEKVKIKPIMYGGGQQRGLRSGTINVPGIAGLGQAAKEAYDNFEERIAYVTSIKDMLIDGASQMDGVTVSSLKGNAGAPHIVSISVEGVKSEVLLHALEDKGICVSSGSACSTHHPGISGTLKGIGLRESLLDSTIRVSLCELNTKEEAEYFLAAMEELIPQLRRFTRK